MAEGNFDEAVKNTFEGPIPKFLEQVEAIAADTILKGKKFLFGDQLTYADFWIGAMYVDNFTNPNVGFGQGLWE